MSQTLIQDFWSVAQYQETHVWFESRYNKVQEREIDYSNQNVKIKRILGTYCSEQTKLVGYEKNNYCNFYLFIYF